MGFHFSGLGPADQMIVQRLQPVMITTIRQVADRVMKGEGAAECKKWFGDASPIWMNSVGKQLQMMASLINTKPITIGFAPIKERCSKEYAAADQPNSGWKNFASNPNAMSVGQNQDYTITLNLLWNSAPLYRKFRKPGDSKFQTLIHECTHLFLDTDDDEYGVQDCEAVAGKSPAVAKKTADNWGYFIEEFHPGS